MCECISHSTNEHGVQFGLVQQNPDMFVICPPIEEQFECAEGHTMSDDDLPISEKDKEDIEAMGEEVLAQDAAPEEDDVVDLSEHPWVEALIAVKGEPVVTRNFTFKMRPSVITFKDGDVVEKVDVIEITLSNGAGVMTAHAPVEILDHILSNAVAIKHHMNEKQKGKLITPKSGRIAVPPTEIPKDIFKKGDK